MANTLTDTIRPGTEGDPRREFATPLRSRVGNDTIETDRRQGLDTFLRHREDAAHRGGPSFPLRSVFFHLTLSRFRNRIELRFAVGVRYTPLGRDPSALL
jgi:hypothetical protein